MTIHEPPNNTVTSEPREDVATTESAPKEIDQIDKILNLYKRLSRNPSLVSARIISIARNGISIQAVWAQRNLERNFKQKFTQDFNLDAELKPLGQTFPVDVSSELLTTSSENERFKAILREVVVKSERKHFIEIWDRQHLIKNYDLSAYDAHGDIYIDNMFSSFHFSPDNSKLMYIAEKKLPTAEPFYKQRPPKIDKNNSSRDEGEESLRGEEYVFKPDWGDQLQGKHKSVIVILDLKTDRILPLPFIPDDYFPGETIWTPNGESIIGVAYKLYPRYLGRHGCSNRESYIFLLTETKFRKLTGPGLACKNPQFSPDGKHLIWLERDSGGPHHSVQRLMHIQQNVIETPEILVDLVKTNITIADGKKFYGFYGETIPKRCWSQDSKYLFISTPQRSNIKSYVISLETKKVYEINNPDGSSLKVLDVRRNRVAFTKFSLIQPPQLVVGKFDPTSQEIGNFQLINCSSPPDIPNMENLFYQHTEFEYKTEDPVKDFNFTYFGFKAAPEKSIPLLVVPHGGPHSSFCNEFNLDYAFFALLGFGILQINYRGSTGMGSDNIEFLSGRIGETDVLDCVIAVNLAFNKYPQIDPQKVTLYGSCHGAFICAHLSSQYAETFRAVVMRAPIVDIYSMYTSTDTPDWCPANTNCLFLEKLPPATSASSYTEIVLKMFDRSPIRYIDKVKAPTMIAVGAKDLRSPASQGRLWHDRLLANNVSTKMFVYDDNHLLADDTVEIDFVINSARWLLEHTRKKLAENSKPTQIVVEIIKK